MNENAQMVRKAEYSSVQESCDLDETEEFIEDMFPVEIRNNLQVDCRVTQDGCRPDFLEICILCHSKKLNST